MLRRASTAAIPRESFFIGIVPLSQRVKLLTGISLL
jgi:hypothetical protein